MNEDQSNKIFALIMMACLQGTVKRTKAGMTEDQLKADAGWLDQQAKNILVEHLNQEEILNALAQGMAHDVSQAMERAVIGITMQNGGNMDMEKVIKLTEEFCSKTLGREVKVEA